MKQKFFTSAIGLVLSIAIIAQSISPSTANDYCPVVENTFTVTLPGIGYTGIFVIGWTPIAPNVTANTYNVVSDQLNNRTTFNFKGKFVDYNNSQTFRVQYTLSGQPSSVDFVYQKIRSFQTPDPVSQPIPTPATITAQRCQIQNFNISFSNVQYANPGVIPKLVYGTVTGYEYLLPIDWKLNGTPSTGNWIFSNNNVTVTSDLSHGDQESIRIRAVNPCAANLTKGPEGYVLISRPGPTLTITPVTQDVICSGSASFTINGMPSGSTVQWSLSNTTQASISSGGTSPTVTVSRIGTANTVVTLSAVVTHCTFVYPPVTHDISLGLPKPNPINVLLIDPTIGKIQVESLPELPGAAMGYKWYKDGVLQSIYHSTFAQISIPRGVCGVTYGISVTATNACGVSAATSKSVYVPPCGNSFIISPNPAANDVTVSADESKTQTTDNKTFDEIRVYDLQGNLKIYQKYSKINQASINISALNNGTYFIEITNGTYKEKQQLIIQK